MTATLHQTRQRSLIGMLIVLMLLCLAAATSQAGTFTIGSADGSFETGLGGMITVGDVQLVSSLGALRPTQGGQAALLTTAPDAGAALSDADVSSLRIDQFTIPVGTAHLRLDYIFLTNELTPSKINDRFTVTLETATETVLLLTVDTFDPTYATSLTGYAAHTGFRTLVADVSAYADTGEPVSLVLRLSDMGDGRGDSAVFLDHMQLTSAEEPQACANYTYVTVQPAEPLFLDASCSSDADDTIVEYHWELGDGTVHIGRFVEHAYATDGVYQATLTVTDSAGNTSTRTFTVAVGSLDHAPQIVSPPLLLAAENTPFHYTVLATDADSVSGDQLTFTLTDAPAGMHIDRQTGVITWTPSPASPRQHAVSVQVHDLSGLSATQTFTVTVGPEVYIAAADDSGRLYVARSNGDGSFADLRFVNATGSNTEGVLVADIDGDGDFDMISGHGEHPRLHLYYYERQGTQFAPPVFLGTVGSDTLPAGGWLLDMAAADVNNDGAMDLVVTGNDSNSWLFLNQGELTFGQATFVASDFESNDPAWGGAECHTDFGRDNSTAASGAWSMRVEATAPSSCLSVDINPANWQLLQGPTLTVAYRIPAGVPVGLLLHVTGHGWLFLGGSPTASPGVLQAVSAVSLIDDDQWHTVTVDLYHAIRHIWPEATQITQFTWWTDFNAAAGAQFWFDNFHVSRRTYASGFSISLLPNSGGKGRGMDAADVNGDGNPDLARGRSSDGQVVLYTGDGSGQFTASAVADPGNDPYGVALADFDTDGLADLIANNGASGDAFFFKGNGDGTFQSGVYLASLDTQNYTAYGTYDFNNDGQPDVVAVDSSFRNVWYYPGNGDATFGPRQLIGNTAMATLGVAAPAGRAIGQPVSVLVAETSRPQLGQTITFDASASYDDGTLVSYTWDFGDGTTASGAQVSHAYTAEGVYTVVVTVLDDDGQQDRRSVRLTVTGAPPVADAGGPYTVNAGAPLTLDAAASFDADGTISSTTWDLNQDGVYDDATGATPAIVYREAGLFSVGVQVVDGALQPTTTSTTVTVLNVPPSVQAGPDLTVNEGEAVRPAVTYVDPDVLDPMTATLDWGDGTPPQTMAVGLVGHWPFDGTADEATGTGLSGTVQGATFSAGQVGQAMTFDGQDDVVSLPTPADADALPAFTWSARIFPVSMGEGGFGRILQHSASDISWSIGWTPTPRMGLQVHTAMGFQELLSDANSITLNAWNHVAVTYDGHTMAFYVNDVPVGSGTTATYTPVGGGEMLVGNRAALDRTFDGRIDDLRLYSTALSAQEVRALYSQNRFQLGTVYIGGNGLVPMAHAYGDDGLYAVDVCVTDDHGGTGCDQLTVTVYNVAPLIVPRDQVAVEGIPVTLSVAFIDPGSQDTHTATIDWGDGTPVELGQVVENNGTGTVSGTHTYVAEGEVPVQVCVTDDDGASACHTLRIVVLENPGPAGPPAGTDYVTVWRGDLRIFAQHANTRVVLIDVATGTPLAVNDPRLDAVNVTTNPFVLSQAGDAFEGISGSGDLSNEIRVRIVASDPIGDAPKPVTVWTGQLHGGTRHPAAPPAAGNPWMSYLPAVNPDGPGNGSELGREFWGFTTRELYLFARKGATPTSITIEDVATNTDADTDDSIALTAADAIYEDDELQIFFLDTFEDDTLHISSTVDLSVMAGYASQNQRDWSVTPPSYTAGDQGSELGTRFYTFVKDSMAIFPTQDNTTVVITDLSDQDDTVTVTLTQGDTEGDYEIYAISPIGMVPRLSEPAVTLVGNQGNVFDNDFVKVEADKPVLLLVGPISNDINDYADVAFTVPLGPDRRLAYVYAQNGVANDLQIFGFDPDTEVTITSLSHSFGDAHDVRIGPGLGGEGGWKEGTPGGPVWWGADFWGGELLRIESTRPITVINGDYDLAHFGAFIPFVQATLTLPPVAQAGPDQEVLARQPFTFDGSQSFDQDTQLGAAQLVYTWDVDMTVDSDGDGDPANDIDLTGPTPTHVYNTAGVFTVQLTFGDDDGESDTDVVIITVQQPPNTPPVAEAGGPYTGTVGVAIILDGTGSTDPDGNPLTYSWDLDNDGVFDDATGTTPTVSFPEQGSYIVALLVSDGLASHTDTATITVLNAAPVITVAPEGSTTEGSAFTEAGAFSDAGADSWTATVDYGDDTGVQPLLLQPDQTFTLHHTYANEGVYTVTLTITDNDGAVGSATLVVTVDNVEPTAHAGADQSVDEGQVVTLNGTGSSDPGTDVLHFMWQQLAGPDVVLDLSDPVQPTFTAPSVPAGGATLTFALTVSDGVADSTPAVVNITITNVNKPPYADAGPTQTVQEGSVVTLDGMGSFDADNELLTYNWLQTSGPFVELSDPTTVQPTFVAPLVDPAGMNLGFSLTVSDGLDTASASTSVQVANVNQPPVAHAGGAQTVNEASLVTLDSTASADPDGDSLTYSWTQTSGTPVTLDLSDPIQPTFSAPLVALGGETLVFGLTVHDGEISSAPATVTITVLNINDPPVCNLAQAAPDRLWPPNHALVSVGIINVSDPDNEALSITLTAVTQDEPVNGVGDGNTSPDAVLQGTEVLVRRERAGGGNGRVYVISFQADDGFHAPCLGTVTVCVPHSKKATCVDDGQIYVSTQP